jgi:hypothetical protein
MIFFETGSVLLDSVHLESTQKGDKQKRKRMPTLPIHNAGLGVAPLSPLLIRQSFALGYFSINLEPKAALALPAVR